jgi:uncharacterized membrane-anchored protein
VSRALRFWLALLPGFAVVAWLVLDCERGLRRGTEVRLEVRAYDPMDPLAGRYLGVPLAIERLERPLWTAPESPQSGQRVWVELRPASPHWIAVACSPAAPTEGRIALAGVVRTSASDALWIDYGLERFYIPHDAADPSVGEPVRALTAVVRVEPGGRGLLTDLEVDGLPFADWNRAQQR